MRKLLTQLAIIAITAGLPVAALAAEEPAPTLASGAPAQLNEHIVVQESVVRVGDLFTNAGAQAEVAVAYSPDPGKRAVFDARWLYRVARAYQVNWQPLGAATQATVERDAISVSQEDIKAQVLMALAEQGVSKEMDVEFSTRFQQIFMPAGSNPQITIENIDYNERSGRFTAIIAAPGGTGVERVRLTGRAFRTIEVPVLKARVLRGDLITEDHIEWTKLKADRVQQDVIVDAQDLIGMTPKRGLRAGTPIRSIEVGRPVMVKKNSLVTVIHQVRNMTLTAQGKALQNGADGELIQILNARSNQVIEAEVVGPGRVAVRTLAQELSMNTN